MAIEIKIPRLGWTMEEGIFVRWLKQDGDFIEPGQPLYELEGEKALQEVEATDRGVLRISSCAPNPGEVVAVGHLIGHLLGEGEQPPPETASRKVVAVSERRQSRDRIAISPRARRVAMELDVDWRQIAGTGRNGRIRERDVRATSKAAAVGDVNTPLEESGNTSVLTARRRTIAQRMLRGVNEAAPVTLTTTADATNLVGLRKQFQATAGANEPAPSYTAFLIKLAAASVQQFPTMCAQWRETGLYQPPHIHIGVAVHTEKGLLAPVVRDVPRLTIRQVNAEIARFVELANRGHISADQLQDGVFTVSNLGQYQIDAFTPILNLPQSAILGIGRIHPQPVVREGQVAVGEVITLSLTFDHRVHDGEPAARFLQHLRSRVENPAPALMG